MVNLMIAHFFQYSMTESKNSVLQATQNSYFSFVPETKTGKNDLEEEISCKATTLLESHLSNSVSPVSFKYFPS